MAMFGSAPFGTLPISGRELFRDTVGSSAGSSATSGIGVAVSGAQFFAEGLSTVFGVSGGGTASSIDVAGFSISSFIGFYQTLAFSKVPDPSSSWAQAGAPSSAWSPINPAPSSTWTGSGAPGSSWTPVPSSTNEWERFY